MQWHGDDMIYSFSVRGEFAVPVNLILTWCTELANNSVGHKKRKQLTAASQPRPLPRAGRLAVIRLLLEAQPAAGERCHRPGGSAAAGF